MLALIVTGVEKVTSSSFQDYGMIVVEFDQKITIAEAKVLIKDKVDQSKAKTDWPNLDNGSKVEPNVFNINISEEVPILNINLKGNYTTQQHKKFGEYLQDEIENVPEFCYSANQKELESKDFSLVPSKYISFVNRDENIDFDQKMNDLRSEFAELLKAEAQSKTDLLIVFKELGYEIKL